MTINILHRSLEHEFYAVVDGKESKLQYRVASTDGKTLDYFQTFVPPELRGRHIANNIVIFALEYANENNFSIIPTCPFVKRLIETHPEYSHLFKTS